MEFVGIIAEYDPFHNGHAWQLEQLRGMGAERIAVAMSCGLTQRGELPLLPESVRAKAALSCGADLVLSLPAPYACAGAEAFARAGVHLLTAAGCGTLAFSAETPDAGLLTETARVLLSEEYRAALKEQLANGARSFAAARQAAVEAVRPGEGLSGLLDKPNNILAVEYCKAIREQASPMQPLPLPRMGAQHDGAEPSCSGFASASALRRLWGEDSANPLLPYVPARVWNLYVDEAALTGRYTLFPIAHSAELVLLRAACTGEAPFARVRGVSEGLEHRLAGAVRQATDFDGLLDALTSARYPRARMRRLAMDAALGYETGALPALPPYLHVLGARREAMPLLKNAALPVSTSLAKLERESVGCAACAAAQVKASDFAALCRARPAPMGESYRQEPVLLP